MGRQERVGKNTALGTRQQKHGKKGCEGRSVPAGILRKEHKGRSVTAGTRRREHDGRGTVIGARRHSGGGRDTNTGTLWHGVGGWEAAVGILAEEELQWEHWFKEHCGNGIDDRNTTTGKPHQEHGDGNTMIGIR